MGKATYARGSGYSHVLFDSLLLVQFKKSNRMEISGSEYLDRDNFISRFGAFSDPSHGFVEENSIEIVGRRLTPTYRPIISN